MRINGKWQIDEHGVLEPVLFATVLDADGAWQEVAFLIDTGPKRPCSRRMIWNRSGFTAYRPCTRSSGSAEAWMF
jgi:hypothetical protein